MDIQRRGDRSGFAAALLAGLLLRLVFLHFHPRFVGDALVYGDLAHNMLARHVFGFTEDGGIRSTLIRLPGYPLFLAACFAVFGESNYLAVLWVQIAIDLASCALLGFLAARLMGRRAGLTAVWLAALCPFTANYSVAALTETLSFFCVALAFFALERWVARWSSVQQGWVWAATAGIAAAVAVSIRPDQGLVAAVVVPVMIWVGVRRAGLVRGLGPAAVAMLIVALPLGLWAGRNWRVFHVVQPLAPRYANDPGEDVPYGFQRWYRTWAIDFKSTVDVYWNYDGNLMKLADLPPRAFDDAQQLAQTRAVYVAYNAETSASPECDRAFARVASERIAAHPLRYYVVLPVARELNMWLRPRTELMKMPLDWWALRAHPRKSTFEIAYALLNAAYLAMALVGLWRWRASGWSRNAALTVAMLSFVFTRCALLLTIDNSEPRYVLECFPVVILLAGHALAGRSRPISD